jgi:hypothetical protein
MQIDCVGPVSKRSKIGQKVFRPTPTSDIGTVHEQQGRQAAWFG